jgi:hypothetical protein
MCSVWEGGLECVEEGRPASLRLPTSLAAVQALPSGLLVLLDQVRPCSYTVSYRKVRSPSFGSWWKPYQTVAF